MSELRIPVTKAHLNEGEELQTFIKRVLGAVRKQRESSQKPFFLSGIYKGFVILRNEEEGSFSRMKLTREKDAVKLSDLRPVQQQFIVAKAEGEEEQPEVEIISKSDDMEIAEIPVEKSFWAGVLS